MPVRPVHHRRYGQSIGLKLRHFSRAFKSLDRGARTRFYAIAPRFSRAFGLSVRAERPRPQHGDGHGTS
jgi:hypothetical protein